MIDHALLLKVFIKAGVAFSRNTGGNFGSQIFGKFPDNFFHYKGAIGCSSAAELMPRDQEILGSNPARHWAFFFFLFNFPS